MLSIRSDFPLLMQKLDDVQITYLDSAATTLKPGIVLEAEKQYVEKYQSNVHRAANALAEEASYQYESARRKIAGWIKADPDLVVMTSGTTYSISSIAYGLQLKEDDSVLCSIGNHHSNLLSWMTYSKVKYIENDPLLPIDPDAVITAIKKYRPKVLAFSWVSNVNGVINPAAYLYNTPEEIYAAGAALKKILG